MAITSVVNVSPHIMTEIMEQIALKPLRHHYVGLGLVNSDNIDGIGSLSKVISTRTEVGEADDDFEGVEYDAHEAHGFAANVTITPTAKIKGIAPTVKSLRKEMPGYTYEQVKSAVASGSDMAVLPPLQLIAEEILQSHYRRAERAVCAEYVNASRAAGLTNTVMSFATLLDAKVQMSNGRPEHRGFVAVIDEIGFGHLEAEILSPTSGLSQVWGDGLGAQFVANTGLEAKDFVAQPSASALGVPLFVGDSSLMSTANAGVDRVGTVACIGRGPTARPGSLRGAMEFTEGHSMAMSLVMDDLADVAKAQGRYEWAVAEHTDLHHVRLIYRAT
jgi:hypothetical protein